MLKDLLKSLYKAKPELIEEHKRLVDTLRTGSKKEQLKEAVRQLKELKELVEKEDRCWEGYKPTPGKKPYEKGSCEPVEKQDEPKSWKIKIKHEPGYHEVKDVLDMGSQQHNSYALHNGRIVSHDQVEDLDITGKKPEGMEKSNYGPKGMGLYNQADNIQRKATRTGEVREGVGRNQAVREYTSTPHGTATQQASRQAAKDKKKSAASPVRSMKDMSEEELANIKAKYATKSDSSEAKISALKAKATPKPEKPLNQKIKEIKQKYSEKPEISDKENIAAIKEKYAGFLQKNLNPAEMQALVAEVSKRQPTDQELELILQYNSRIAQDLGNLSANVNEQEDLGY